MASLDRISVSIMTSDKEDAGTNGYVYFGTCGREFACDTEENDFKRGSISEFIFGDGSNVNNPDANSPHNPQMQVEDVDLFPMYIRFVEDDEDDAWSLHIVEVRLNGADNVQYYRGASGGIWLGKEYGGFYFLKKLGAGGHSDLEKITNDKSGK